MRRAAKRDKNEPDCIKALRKNGWIVTKLSGPGLPDLMCHRAGATRFVEVKSPGGKMEAAQVDLHEAWERAGVFVAVADTVMEACCGLMTYRDFPWEGVPEAEKRKRLALTAAAR